MVEIDPKAFAKLCGDGWNAGDTKPDKAGTYLRKFTDGEFSQYFDGQHWFSISAVFCDLVKHWRQVGDYPCWRTSV